MLLLRESPHKYKLVRILLSQATHPFKCLFFFVLSLSFSLSSFLGSGFGPTQHRNEQENPNRAASKEPDQRLGSWRQQKTHERRYMNRRRGITRTAAKRSRRILP